VAANDRMVAVALSRVTFEELASPTPLQAELRDHQAELRTLQGEHVGPLRAEVRHTVGGIWWAFVMAGVNASLLVMQEPTVARELEKV